MKQEPISCRADNALAARCQSFAARWACVLKRPIFYLAAYIDNNYIIKLLIKILETKKVYVDMSTITSSYYLHSLFS